MEIANRENTHPFFISDEDMIGIRDSTIDLCRLYQKEFAEKGGTILVEEVRGDMDDLSWRRFAGNYASLSSMSTEEAEKLEELDGFKAMGALIQMLEASKFGGK